MNGNIASLPEVKEALTLVHSLIGEDLAAVEERLASDLPSEFTVVPEVARHLIGAGGKRVRPVLVCLTARALGATGESFHELAAIVEMVHTATLFHDDVIDEARMRRGKAAAHHVYGAPVAILVGDRLYSDAFGRLLSVSPRKLAFDLSKAVRLVLEGEIFQLQRRGRSNLTYEQYLRLVGGKTAALFRFATIGAARIARARPEQVRAAAHYGWNLGVAFQMTDDIIDFESEAATGKTRFKDLDEKKVSLPLLLGQRKDAELRRLVTDFMDKELSGEERLNLRGEIVRRVEACGAGLDARELASRYAERAREALSVFPATAYTQAMMQIARYVCARNS